MGVSVASRRRCAGRMGVSVASRRAPPFAGVEGCLFPESWVFRCLAPPPLSSLLSADKARWRNWNRAELTRRTAEEPAELPEPRIEMKAFAALMRPSSGVCSRHVRRVVTPARGLSSQLEPGFGLLFDIDGVLVRGKTPIPAAKRAFQKLVDAKGQFLVPVVFVTNAGNCLRQKKADQLSHILGVPISQDQVMMSHSPLRMFKKFHDKHVLVSGQGPVLDIAKNVGFTNVVSMDMLRESFPLLDMVDHNRRPKLPSSPVVTLPRVEAVVLFGEPIRWETNLQLIVDVLLTSGNLSGSYESRHTHTHLPLLACNMDLMWMAEAHSPRFGHGTFMVCLESIYKKITGQDLKYEALMGKPSELTYHYAEFLIREQASERGWRQPITSLYAVGDNLMTDIYGANLYNRYLEERVARKSRAVANVGSGSGTIPRDSDSDSESNGWESELASPSATSCKSILVCTGVYNPHLELPRDAGRSVTETVFHGHRDFCFDPALVEPESIVPDVDAAVQLIFQMEEFGSKR